MKPLWGHIGQGHNSSVSKKQLCFLFFIKSSLLACGIFQDTDNMFTQCTIVYYLHKGMQAKSGMRMRCGQRRRDGGHKWVSGDNDAVAIMRLWLSCCCCYHITVASARGVWGRVGQGEVGKWSRWWHDNCKSIIVTLSSLPRHCCECDSVQVLWLDMPNITLTDLAVLLSFLILSD